MEKLKLVRPSLEYGEQAMEFKREFQAVDSSMDGCGPLRRCETAAEWVADAASDADPATLREGRVLATTFITVRQADNRLVGMLQVRHYLNDHLEKFGGHIGYCVRPSERRKGYGAEQLRLALAWCREELGLEKVLITCFDTNEASRRTILSQGGVYENTVHEPEENVDLERYWITLK